MCTPSPLLFNFFQRSQHLRQYSLWRAWNHLGWNYKKRYLSCLKSVNNRVQWRSGSVIRKGFDEETKCMDSGLAVIFLFFLFTWICHLTSLNHHFVLKISTDYIHSAKHRECLWCSNEKMHINYQKLQRIKWIKIQIWDTFWEQIAVKIKLLCSFIYLLLCFVYITVNCSLIKQIKQSLYWP